MDVLYVTDSPINNSIGRYTMDLYRITAPDSHIVQFVFNRANLSLEYGDYALGYNLRYPFSAFNHMFSRYIFRDKKMEIEASKSIVHITSSTSYIPIEKSNVVVTIHDLFAFEDAYKDDYPGIVGFSIRRSTQKYLKCKNIVVDSNHVKEQILERFDLNEGRLTVIYVAIPENMHPLERKNEIRNELNLPQDKKLILSVTNNSKRKNLPMIQNVIDHISDEYKIVRVGPPLKNSINLGSMDDVTLNKVYNACDALFFPTVAEGFGIPVIEAFAVGLPVVSSSIDVIREVAGDAALLVDPMDLTENLEGIYKATENTNYYRRKGLERAKMFSRDTIKERLVNFYKGLEE